MRARFRASAAAAAAAAAATAATASRGAPGSAQGLPPPPPPPSSAGLKSGNLETVMKEVTLLFPSIYFSRDPFYPSSTSFFFSSIFLLLPTPYLRKKRRKRKKYQKRQSVLFFSLRSLSPCLFIYFIFLAVVGGTISFSFNFKNTEYYFLS